MSVFSKPVFEGTVEVDGNELFKGQGAARQWAQQVGSELGVTVQPCRIGSGWALCATLDGVEVVWGIFGQRLKRISPSAGQD
ncbi:MAG TPA: hypothetical protein VIM12_12880 [Noviherbaspirillum sp.]|jgi:hypothetical protein|uniref:hypothetical protein n=1 Tax=Noviherbaspirillum sp. TaxID=1926288 RepID=UPI002F94C66F